MTNLLEDPKALYSELLRLVQLRLVHIRFNHDQTLIMFKYTRDVFYKGSWDLSPALLEARGIVFTNPVKTGKTEIAVLPFRKVFNDGETDVKIDPDRHYTVIRKINGFMASVSRNPLTGEALITTTGSFDSPYVKMAREMLEADAVGRKHFPFEDETWLYEIVHQDDPHVMPEKLGAHYLGSRLISPSSDRHARGDIVPNIGELLVAKMSGRRAIELAGQLDNIEGFMLFDDDTRQFVAKLKTRAYKTRKFLMRVGGPKLRAIWDNPSKARLAFTDEEFWPVFDKLRDVMSFEQFVSLEEQDRRIVLDALG